MLDRETIESAKQADIDTILQEFNWQMDSYGRIRCPHPAHNDRSPSCCYSAARHTFKCFGCGKVFDTIDLYQCLCEKVNGRTVPFYKAVEEILDINGSTGGVTANQSPIISPSSNNVYNSFHNSNSRTTSKSNAFDLIMNNSKPITGFELNYLHSRGIFLYDSYVYDKQVYTAKNIEKTLLTATNQSEINRLNEIKSNGTLYRGIAPILKANRVQIKHNYWQGVNSIIYLISYNAVNDDDLCIDQFFEDTERHMAIQKTLDNSHTKRALGTSNFNFITRGINSGDIYICEGVEDSLSFTQNGLKSISLNSIANLQSLMQYLENDYTPQYNEKLIIAFDHDEAGRKATNELITFFEDYNNRNPNRKYQYNVCNYPHQFHDINDYWVSKVFQ